MQRIVRDIGFSIGVAAGMLVCAADLHAAKPPPAKWTSAGQLGSFRLVAVENAHPRKLAVFWDALRAACQKRTHCNAMFVDARDLERVRALPEREQKDIALMVYTTNRGFEWNCRFRPDADNCFAWE